MELVGLVAGSGWGSGLNIYAVTLLLGLARRAGWADLPDIFGRTDLMVAAGIMFFIEFAADKIPYLDNAWDAIHTAIRPIGAAAIGALLVGDADSIGQAVGAVVAGSLALSSHATKATTRVVANASPEPVSNIGLSVIEDTTVLGVMAAAFFLPVLAILIVLAGVVAGGFLVHRIWGVARRIVRRRRGGTPSPA